MGTRSIFVTVLISMRESCGQIDEQIRVPGPDRAGAITPGPQILDNVLMGQATLIDYLYYCGVIRVLPDGPKILARSPHYVTLPCVQMNEPF